MTMKFLDGASMIVYERIRQVTVKGYKADHDADHVEGELARAAVALAIPNRSAAQAVQWWPWKNAPTVCFNVNNATSRQLRIRELSKAGALIAAEIDRLLALS